MLRQLLASGVIRHAAGRSGVMSATVTRSISATPAMLQTFKNYTPNNLEKRFLVWAGKYKTVEDVPSHIRLDACCCKCMASVVFTESQTFKLTVRKKWNVCAIAIVYVWPTS